MLSGAALAQLLESEGCDFFTGVPCSLVQDVIAALEGHPRLPYVPAVREDVAVGVAAGAWLAGRMPVVLMQNSGLGTSLNALSSLSLMYGLPAVLIVTWRGWQGQDAPEHLLTGAITPGLLALLGIPARLLSEAGAAADVAWARQEAARRAGPVAILVPPGVVRTGGHADGPPREREVESRPGEAPRVVRRGRHAGARSGSPRVNDARLAPEISRFEALGAAVSALGDEPVVHANGYVCRESIAVKDRPQNFYMIGSMGLASAIALGVALARPQVKVVVFDGDGNLLMNLGILPMIGGGPLLGRPWAGNLLHVVFDNDVYGSTGNQTSPSRHARLDALARAAGYRRVAAVTAAADVTAALAAAVAGDGPSFVLVKVTADEHPAPRIPYPPAEIRDRFRRALEEVSA